MAYERYFVCDKCGRKEADERNPREYHEWRESVPESWAHLGIRKPAGQDGLFAYEQQLLCPTCIPTVEPIHNLRGQIFAKYGEVLTETSGGKMSYKVEVMVEKGQYRRLHLGLRRYYPGEDVFYKPMANHSEMIDLGDFESDDEVAMVVAVLSDRLLEMRREGL